MRKLLNLTALLLALLLFQTGALQAAGLETQTNREGSVTVKVTPRNISPQAKSWDFEITLTTHTVSLDQDMGRAAVLVFGSGKQAPLAWEGDPPGGHHRKGVLRFLPPSVFPRFIELHISGIGDVSPRVFRWRLAE
jgi:hypothetical protein